MKKSPFTWWLNIKEGRFFLRPWINWATLHWPFGKVDPNGGTLSKTHLHKITLSNGLFDRGSANGGKSGGIPCKAHRIEKSLLDRGSAGSANGGKSGKNPPDKISLDVRRFDGVGVWPVLRWLLNSIIPPSAKGLWFIGLLAAWALAPHHFWILGVFSIMALMMVGWFCTSWHQAWRCGWWWGWGFYMGSLYWIGHSLWIDAPRFAWLWPGAILGVPAFLALYIAFMMGTVLLFRRHFSLSIAEYSLAFALFWSTTEWIQGHMWTGFPWNLTAYIWGSTLSVAQMVAFMGSYGLGLMTVLWIAIMGGMILGNGTRHGGCWWRRALGAGIFGLISLGLCSGLGHWRLAQNPTQFQEKVRLRCVQPAIAQKDKMDGQHALDHWQRLLRLSFASSFSPTPVLGRNPSGNVSGNASGQEVGNGSGAVSAGSSGSLRGGLPNGVDPSGNASGQEVGNASGVLLGGAVSVHPKGPSCPYSPTHVIWPEGAYPWCSTPETMHYFPHVGPTTVVLGGDYRPKQNKVYNSLLVRAPDQPLKYVYAKMHLVPCGEYIPFRDFLEICLPAQWLRKVTPGAQDFSDGPPQYALQCAGLPPFRCLICYESIFPGTIRNPKSSPSPKSINGRPSKTNEADPQWILNITNDGWFGDSWGPHQHFLSARFRAIEEGLSLVRVANTGISAIVDPLGRIVQALPLFQEGVLDGHLPCCIPLTPYGLWQDRIWAMAMFCMAGVIALARVVRCIRARMLRSN